MAIWLWVGHVRRPNPPPERRLPARERHRWVAVYIMIPVLLGRGSGSTDHSRPGVYQRSR